MARKSKKKSTRRTPKSCGCPANSVRVSTKKRGRGFVCLAKADTVRKRHGLTYVTHKFVKAVGCR